MVVVAHAEALWSKVIGDPQCLQFTQCSPHWRRSEWLNATDTNGESISCQVPAAKFVGMPRGPQHLHTLISDGAHLRLARQVDTDGLTRHRHAILHARGADGFGANVKVLAQHVDHLMMSHPLFDDTQVQVLALATRVVELQFFNKKVTGALLDARAFNIGKLHQALRRKRRWQE